MNTLLINLSGQRRYWAILILVGIALEAGALYYQYVLDEWPCVLCIHVRILVMAFVLIGVLAIFCTGSTAAMRLFHGLNSLVMGWLVVIDFPALKAALPKAGVYWLTAGGLAYTVGIVFYVLDHRHLLKHSHGIWHLFVLAGSIFHFVAIIVYVR